MKDVIIIGAGLSGLSAANYLHRAGQSVLLLEASDGVGGRVKTTEKEGFLLDHGFQVFAKAYLEAQALLDYRALDFRPFLPGALLLQADGSKDRIGDPSRDWSSLFPTLFAKAGSLGSKLNILKLKRRLADRSVADIFSESEQPTIEALKEYGFDEQLIDRFFRPFYSGIFLEQELNTSRRMFDFVFKMFAEGEVAVPSRGMQAIPQQLASNLPEGSILLNKTVVNIDAGKVTTADGQVYEGKKVLLATEAITLAAAHIPPAQQEYVSTTQLYFSANQAPLMKPIIALNTQKGQLVNNFSVLSRVAPSYAPPSKHLLSASIIGSPEPDDATLEQQVKKELSQWFGNATTQWELLDIFKVQYALPVQKMVVNTRPEADFKLSDQLFICGDHMLNGSINGAMRSGRLAAEAMLKM